MKKIVEKLLGVKVVSDVKNINGHKSNGAEDCGGGYKYWRKDFNDSGWGSIS